MSVLSLLVTPLTQPLTWVALLLLLAIWWLPRRPAAARGALVVALVGGVAVGWTPIPDALLRRLEDPIPAPPADLTPFEGLVVLGGGVEPVHHWRGATRPALNRASERFAAAGLILHGQPHLKLIYSGREAGFSARGSNDEGVRMLASFLGIDSKRIVYEDRSRNTVENARLSAALAAADRTKPWLLVTSAWHMSRALEAFRAAGWNVAPFPVDYMTGRTSEWTEYSIVNGAQRWQTFLKEFLGRAAYAAASALGRGN